MKLKELLNSLNEAWSEKYKRSINCSNPKGFSQRAHCQGRKKNEDVEQDPGQPIPFPKGTTIVDVSDVYDWYKLGMVISDLDDANPQLFGQGGPGTVIAFGSEEEEHKLLPHLKRLGLNLHDIDKPSDIKKAIPAKALIDKFEESVDEARRKKKKVKQAAYGPGPYGWYGFYPGYSGEGESGEGGGDAGVGENFADGKKPGRKGLAKRTGVDCKQPVSKLRSIAKNSSGERQRMAHWCANMKSGRNKK